jgi:DNA repair exonuclease SbcCD nuclease subunit
MKGPVLSYRILHIADVHLETTFGVHERAFGAMRRAQLRAAFERALDLARERGADAICIAGDLYEDRHAGPDTAAYVRRCLGALAPVRVFLSPGNHDPCTAGSVYRQMQPLPSNVVVFDERKFRPERLADGLTLWGMGQTSALDHARALAGFRCTGDGLHLLLFHGSDEERMPPGKETIAPFNGAEIASAGATHAMVGHFHGKVQASHHAYPGSPEPLNAGQDGEHTASIVTVDDGRVTVTFEPLNKTRYLDAEIDVAGYEDSAALVQAVRENAASVIPNPGSIFCRFRLIGGAPASLDPDLHALRDEMIARYPGFELVEEYRAFDLDAIAHEGNTVRAAFVTAMRERIAGAGGEELATQQAALRYGLLAFAKKRLRA